MPSKDQHFSFEFFPPKTNEGQAKLRASHAELSKLHPEFFSVTFGAGGSTRERTFDTVRELLAAGSDTAPHLSCIGTTRDELGRILDDYRRTGIKRLVALRGDLPSGMGGTQGEFRHANELVAFVREYSGDHFHIEVAAYPEFHPQATSATRDLEHFVRKVQAGANGALTQYFYNADAYFGFIDACAKQDVTIPIVPGIMPITNFTQLARFSDACGAEIPRWIRRRLESYGDDMESIRSFGEEVVTQLCERLLEQGAPGLHFYTMNRTEPTMSIWKNLNLPASA